MKLLISLKKMHVQMALLAKRTALKLTVQIGLVFNLLLQMGGVL